MKKSAIRKLIREILEEQVPPKPKQNQNYRVHLKEVVAPTQLENIQGEDVKEDVWTQKQ